MRRRTLEQVTADGDLPWFAPAVARLSALRGETESDATLAEFFVRDAPVTIARAPGRLDVMGGIADYSGSLVLEMPLACATFAITQRRDDPRLDVASLRGDRVFRFSIDLGDITSGALSTAESLSAWFDERPDDRWAAYIVGTVHRCLTTHGPGPVPGGLRLLVMSDVPEGKGVSSSAALEVATMAATAASFEIEVEGPALAASCQWAENHIARAPCGIMDQMTSALGRRDRLLRLRCQPSTVEGHVTVPAGFRFYGIDSGIRHAVTGADYGTVRTAAFMGYRIIADLAGLVVTRDGSRVRVTDHEWGGYLANIGPNEFATRFVDVLPIGLRGSEFLARYGGITDDVTRVEPERWYPIRQAASHPVFEHDRVTRFASLLEAGLDDRESARRMGALMFRSHASYSSCGLGSDGTDRLVDLVADADPGAGVFGAKITGGGSGGTVAVFGTDAARAEVYHIARVYERETGLTPVVFDGSSPGAEELGVVTVHRDRA